MHTQGWQFTSPTPDLGREDFGKKNFLLLGILKTWVEDQNPFLIEARKSSKKK